MIHLKIRVPTWARLAIVCVIVGGLLGFVNAITAGPIAQRAAEAAEAARRSVFTEADSFEPLELAADSGVDNCYAAM